jgi:hypothetical protein
MQKPTVFSPRRGAHEAAGRVRPPLRYAIDAAAGVIFVDLLSVKSPPAVITAMRDIRSDPAYRPTLGILIECCYLRGVPSAELIRELARACFTECRPEIGGLVAIVAASDTVYSAARFFAALTAAPRDRLRVFNHYSEAIAWLRPVPSPSGADQPWAPHASLLLDAARRARLAHP